MTEEKMSACIEENRNKEVNKWEGRRKQRGNLGGDEENKGVR